MSGFVWVLCKAHAEGSGTPPLQAFASAADALTALRLMKMADASVRVFKVPIWPSVTGDLEPEPESEESLAADHQMDTVGLVPGGSVPVLPRPARITKGVESCAHSWIDDACEHCGEKL